MYILTLLRQQCRHCRLIPKICCEFVVTPPNEISYIHPLLLPKFLIVTAKFLDLLQRLIYGCNFQALKRNYCKSEINGFQRRFTLFLFTWISYNDHFHRGTSISRGYRHKSHPFLSLLQTTVLIGIRHWCRSVAYVKRYRHDSNSID